MKNGNDFKLPDFNFNFNFDFNNKETIDKPKLPENARQNLENYLKNEDETYCQIKNKQLSLMELSCQTDFYFSVVCNSLEDRELLCEALGIDWSKHLDNGLFISSRDFVNLILVLKNGNKEKTSQSR